MTHQPNNVSAAGVADALEREYLKVANGEIKPAKMSFEPMVRAVQKLRELAAASAKPRDACVHDNFSTRVCEYGTRGCIAEHAAPSPAAREAGDGVSDVERDAARYRWLDAQKSEFDLMGVHSYYATKLWNVLGEQEDWGAVIDAALLREAGSR
jgi:hypothetical protein